MALPLVCRLLRNIDYGEDSSTRGVPSPLFTQSHKTQEATDRISSATRLAIIISITASARDHTSSFVSGTIGVRNSDDLIRGNTKILALHPSGSHKLRRRDIGGRNTLFLKVCNVVRTARDARPSRTDRFNNPMTTRENILADLRFRHPRR